MLSYFTSKDNIISLVRTAMAYFWAFLLSKFAIEVSPELQAAFVLLIGTGIYQVIRVGAERWGWLGWLLGFNTKPEYPTTNT